MAAFLTDRAWRAYRGADFPTASWAFEREVLQALADGPAVSLISRERFADFDLTLEWRLPVAGNSGILYRVNEDLDAPWQSGPEMQLVDDTGHPDGRVPETSCGALYGLYAPHEAPLCAPGLYNIARVRVRGSSVEHWLNGTRVLACDLASEDFRARVARSKFSRFADFACAADGHIVLQHHGTDVWFRKVRIATGA
jgi:hypothetical protein